MYRKILFIGLSGVLLFYSSFYSQASDTSSTQANQTITISLSDWNQYKANQSELQQLSNQQLQLTNQILNLLSQSGTDLTQQQQTLLKALTLSEQLQTQITSSQKEIANLLTSQNSLETALNEAKQSSQKTTDQLAQVNKDLKKQSNELKRVKVERNALMVILSGVLIYEASK